MIYLSHSASVARIERSEIRCGIDASWQSRITLRSIRATLTFSTGRCSYTSAWITGSSPVVTRNGRADRGSIKNCESLHALLLRYFKVLRHFGESFLAVEHAKGKIGIAARANASFAALA
jgi:hypothetical protein